MLFAVMEMHELANGTVCTGCKVDFPLPLHNCAVQENEKPQARGDESSIQLALITLPCALINELRNLDTYQHCSLNYRQL